MTTQSNTQSSTHGKASLSFPSDTELVVSRDFAYPPELVWRASTTPEIVKQWWGIAPRDQFVVCDIDLRVGGSWRYVFRDEQGNEDGFSAVPRARRAAPVRPDRAVRADARQRAHRDRHLRGQRPGRNLAPARTTSTRPGVLAEAAWAG